MLGVRDTRLLAREKNVELVTRSWEASLAEDWPAVLAMLHPEAEIRDFDVPDADINRGHEGFLHGSGAGTRPGEAGAWRASTSRPSAMTA